MLNPLALLLPVFHGTGTGIDETISIALNVHIGIATGVLVLLSTTYNIQYSYSRVCIHTGTYMYNTACMLPDVVLTSPSMPNQPEHVLVHRV